MAVFFAEDSGVLEEIANFAEVVSLNLFVAREGERYLVNTVGLQSFSGRGDLWVPILIAALIVFIIMIGAVYERMSEIGTLNAIGLAPVHVAVLFLAEAAVFANLSGVLGYLLAQFMARLGWIYDLFPALTLNYSSLSAIITMSAIMLVVLLSALYPARKAAQICMPGVERKWRLPPPEGRRLQVPMPFVLREDEARALVAFLGEYLDAYNEQSIGAGFYAESLHLGSTTTAAGLRARLWLAPFDQGKSPDLEIATEPEADQRFCSLHMYIDHLSGNAAAWLRANRTLVNDLRKQFLVWHALPQVERDQYIREVV